MLGSETRRTPMHESANEKRARIAEVMFSKRVAERQDLLLQLKDLVSDEQIELYALEINERPDVSSLRNKLAEPSTEFLDELFQNKDQLIERLVDPETKSSALFALKRLLLSEDHRSTVAQRLIEVVQDHQLTVSDAAEMRYGLPEPFRTEFFDSVIHAIGLPPEKMHSAWRAAFLDREAEGDGNRAQSSLEYAVSRELKIMSDLETVSPGIASFLESKQGIRILVRFPKSLLLKQREVFENKDIPYGIMVMARMDHDNSFSFTLHKPLEKAQSGLGDQGVIRLIEVDSTTELARRLLDLEKRYGDSQKIQFIIGAGHGQGFFGEGVHLGSDSSRESSTLNVQDLTGLAAKKAKRFFVENPDQVLISCTTGDATGGIAKKLSSAIGGDTTAPAYETTNVDLETRVVDGRLRINARFPSTVTNTFTDGVLSKSQAIDWNSH